MADESMHAREPTRAGPLLVELVRIVIVIIFTALGYQIARAIVTDPTSARVVVGALLGSSTGYVLGGVLGRTVGSMVGSVESTIAAMEGAELVAGGAGVVGGVLVGTAVGLPLLLLPSRAVGVPMLAFVQVVVGAIGWRIGVAKREDLLQLFGLTYRTRASDLRVLDTSAILNTQLLDYVRAGLLRGVVLVPTFVLEEAQGLADSADPVRRQRARHGLEALSAIKREALAEVRSVDKSYPEFDQVDAKLIALARERGAAIVTDDGALAQVAELQGIEVIHLRRIATVLRPSALPGEPIRIELVRAGKDAGQAIGYLDDGSMVVVEHGAALVGQTVDAIVRRVVQTSGGRLLFAGLGDDHPEAGEPMP